MPTRKKITCNQLRDECCYPIFITFVEKHFGNKDMDLSALLKKAMKEDPSWSVWLLSTFLSPKDSISWAADCVESILTIKSKLTKKSIKTARTWSRRSSSATEATLHELEELLYKELMACYDKRHEWEYNALMSLVSIPYHETAPEGSNSTEHAINAAENACSLDKSGGLDYRKKAKMELEFSQMGEKYAGTVQAPAQKPKVANKFARFMEELNERE